MSRMDRYNENDVQENDSLSSETVVLSRINKNQRIYEDVYFNSSVVDINNIMNGENNEVEEQKDDAVYQEESYEEKNYDVNDYLQKAHEKLSPDDAKRSINDNDFQQQEDEIRKLIASIDEKEEQDDFFSDLKGDNEDTLIGAKFKTDEFNESIYETLKEESIFDGNTILDHVLSDNTVVNLEKEEDAKIDHAFDEIVADQKVKKKKKSTLPIIIFSITTFMLIAIILIIIFK